MPSQVPDFNDLNLPYGTAQLTLGGGYNNMPNTVYYVEDWSADTDVNIVNVPNEVGKIRGRVIVDRDKGGSATLQMPSTASATLANVPRVGATGSVPIGFAATGSTATIMVTSVSTPRNVNDYAKVTIGWLLNSP